MRLIKEIKAMSKNWRCSTSTESTMPRGELEDHVLLCSYEDKQGTLHGIALRKCTEGSIRIDLAPVRCGSFSETDLVLTIPFAVAELRSIRVNPELHGVCVPKTDLILVFKDTEDVKDAISQLLEKAVQSTLHNYHGFCLVDVAGDKKFRPAFVFMSPFGRYTALHITSVPIYASASTYINFIQPNLPDRSYWRATCFEPLGTAKPAIVKWAKEIIDLTLLRHVVLACVLTFNSLNCPSNQECDEDGVYQGVMDSIPCPYDRSL